MNTIHFKLFFTLIFSFLILTMTNAQRQDNPDVTQTNIELESNKEPDIQLCLTDSSTLEEFHECICALYPEDCTDGVFNGDFSFTPQPTVNYHSGTITVVLSNQSTPRRARIIIRDIGTAKLVYDKTIQVSPGSKTVDFDNVNLQYGIYFVILDLDGDLTSLNISVKN